MIDIAEQRSIIIRHQPRAIRLVEGMLRSGELATMVDSRLTSGDKVFGSSMFDGKFTESEARFEFVEELADAIVYACLYLWLMDGGHNG